MRLLLVLLFLLPLSAEALVSEGRPGIPYYNHPLFLDKKIFHEGKISQVRLAYGDTRDNSPDCRNTIDVFLGLEHFLPVPDKSWVLVDYHLQSILVDSGFFGDADVFRVRACGDLNSCVALREQLENDPAELASRPYQKPKNIKPARIVEIEEELDIGRKLVRAARCRGCHEIEGFGAPHAPGLTWKRYKYVEGWLESYLHNPYRLRPAMDDLMMLDYTSSNAKPNLQTVEVSALSEFLERVAKAKSPDHNYRGEPWQDYDCFRCHTDLYQKQPLSFVPTPVPSGLRKDLARSDMLQDCLSCHAFGDYRQYPPTGRDNPNRLAPDLLLAMEKLDIDYLVNYVNRPDYLQPGASMPAMPLDEAAEAELRELVRRVREMIGSGELQPVHNRYQLEKAH